MADATRQRLTVFLLQDVDDFSDAIDDEARPNEVALTADVGLDGRFYWQAKNGGAPDWMAFIAPALSEPPTLRTASSSGLLVLRCDERFFALTFGYGRGLMDQSKIVRQFGLKAVLNTIDPAQIRSLDTKTFEDMVVAKNTQASRSTTLSTFEVDVVRDILRAVTGEPRDDKLGKRVSGADSVVLNIGTAVGGLNAVCRDLLAAYSAETYKKHFAWVDDLSIVVDAATIDELDDLLLGQLKTRDTGNTHLAMPDVLDWGEVDAFKITGTRDTEYDDLDLDAYLDVVPRLGDLTLQTLKQRKVQVKFARSTNWDSRWSLYQCLVSEQRTTEGLFALIEGRWFKISDTLAGQVDQYAASLGHASIELPAAFTAEKEADYNRRLAGVDPQNRLCLDAQLVTAQGATSSLEVCDVLVNDGTLLHVKRKSRSSTLSHLFSQGVVSMTTMLLDGAFRDRVRELIKEQAGNRAGWDGVVPSRYSVPDRERFTVSYVVLANSTRSGTDWLPFFSKLSLMQAVRSLQATHGVTVTIDRVDVVDPEDADTPDVIEDLGALVVD